MTPIYVLYSPRCLEEFGIVEGVKAYAADMKLDWDVQPVNDYNHTQHAFDPVSADAVVIARNAHRYTKFLTPQSRFWVELMSLQIEDRQGDATVAWDVDSQAQAAARYLHMAGVQTFAVPGEINGRQGLPSRQLRHRAFIQAVQDLGGTAIEIQRTNSYETNQMVLQNFCRRMPKPLGFFLFHDRMAEIFIHELNKVGVSVPHEALVVGGNSSAAAAASRIPISSVRLSYKAMGRAAALQAHRLLTGDKPAPLNVKAFGVIERQSSTPAIKVNNPIIAKANARLARHSRPIPSVAELARHCKVCRQTLLRNFQQELGSSPSQWIESHAMQRAAELLETTDLKQQDIAQQCGFAHRSNLSVRFKRHHGISPQAYRSHTQGR